MTSVVAAKINYSDGSSEKTLGVTDVEFLGDAEGLVDNVWYPYISKGSDVSWTERARHEIQGGSGDVDIGDLVLDNSGGQLDHWIDYDLVGYKVDIRRAKTTNASWSNMEQLPKALISGVRFVGRSEVVLELTSLLARLDGPAYRARWEDGEAPNPALANKAKRLVLGQVFQLKPDDYFPSELIYYAADNFESITKAAEGGNPTDSAVNHPQGFQLLQSPKHVVTCDLVGPPSEIGASEIDLIESIGSFVSWAGGEPNGWDFYTVAGKSSLTETVQGDVSVVSTGEGDTDTGDLAPSSAESGPYWPGWQPSTGSSLTSVIQADTGSYVYAEVPGSGRSADLIVKPSITMPPDAVITGVEIEVVVEGPQNAMLRDLSLFTKNGTVPLAQNLAIGSKQSLVYGGDGNLLGTQWSWDLVRAGRFGVKANISKDANYNGAPTGIARIHQVRFKIYYSQEISSARMYVPGVSLTPGGRYMIRFHHTQDQQSVIARFGSVDASGDPILEPGSSFSDFEKRLDGTGITQADFIPDRSMLGIELYRGNSTTGTITLTQIEVIDLSTGMTVYSELASYLFDSLGMDWAYDTSNLRAHDSEVGFPPIGMVVEDESVSAVLTRMVTSLRGYGWRGIDGKFRSKAWNHPSENQTAYLFDSDGKQLLDSDGKELIVTSDTVSIKVGEERIKGPIEVYDDRPDAITDRARGAKNQYPISEDRAATISSTWTEEDRAKVAADFRVTKTANIVLPLVDSDGAILFDSDGKQIYVR